MAPYIEIGRTGYRAVKAVPPSDTKNCVIVDARAIIDFDHKKLALLPLDKVADALRKQHGKRFDDLVDQVVHAILDDRNVHVKCQMGQNRSQAVAWTARTKLLSDHPNIAFRGPVCLGDIKPRFQVSTTLDQAKKLARPSSAPWRMLVVLQQEAPHPEASTALTK